MGLTLGTARRGGNASREPGRKKRDGPERRRSGVRSLIQRTRVATETAEAPERRSPLAV